MKKIYLIDGNSFIYRMFFAIPEFTNSSGMHLNAVFGMAKLFLGQFTKENPDYLIFIKDAPGDNFRHTLYADYKATRERMPDNLRSQISLIEDMIKKMGIESIEVSGYEADDIIGTLAHSLGQDENNDIYILSGDKDLYSLTAKNIKIYDTMKAKIYDDIGAGEKFGVESKYIIDYLAIVGDTADNIPGVPGFGPKKAVDLINTYGGVEDIYSHIEDNDFIFKGKTLEKLKEGKELAYLSKKLATIPKDVDIPDFYLEKYKFKSENLLNNDTKKLFGEYEFKSLYQEEKNLQTWDDLGLEVQIIKDDASLETLFEKMKNYSEIFLDTETTSLDVIEAELVGVSIYLDDENIFYINIGHDGEKVSFQALQDFLKNLLSLDILIVGHNLKYDLQIIEMFLKKDDTDEKQEIGGQMSLMM